MGENAKHDPCRMTFVDSFNRKQGGRVGGRKWNVWYNGYRCPVCAAFASRPRNPFKGRKIGNLVCDGITYGDYGKRLKRPARMKD